MSTPTYRLPKAALPLPAKPGCAGVAGGRLERGRTGPFANSLGNVGATADGGRSRVLFRDIFRDHSGGDFSPGIPVGKSKRELVPRRALGTQPPDASGKISKPKIHMVWANFRLARNDEELEEAAAIVAAMLGHGSDLTATAHYGRTKSRRAWARVPEPDKQEVLRVKKRLLTQRRKLDDAKALKKSADSPKIGP